MSYENESTTRDMPRETTEMKLLFECTDATKEESKIFAEPIDVLAWSYGSHYGHNAETKKDQAFFQDLSLTKYITEQSPLFLKCISEKRIFKSITLESVNKNQIVKVKMYDAFISSLATGGSGGEYNLTENIAIAYHRVEFTYDTPKVTSSKTTPMTSGALENKDPGSYSRNRY